MAFAKGFTVRGVPATSPNTQGFRIAKFLRADLAGDGETCYLTFARYENNYASE